MELNEFHITHFCTGPIGEGMPFTCVFPRTGADCPASSNPAGCKNRCVGLEDMKRPIDAIVGEASRQSPIGLEQMTNRVLHENLHASVDPSFLEGSNQL